MKKNINLIVITLLVLSFFAFSGFNCESGDGIELRIMAIGGGFSGYYTINGELEIHSIESTPVSSDSLGDNALSIHRYREDLGIFRYIEITVTKANPYTAMDMYLFNQNGDVIQKVNNTSCSSGGSFTSTCQNASSSMSYTFRTN